MSKKNHGFQSKRLRAELTPNDVVLPSGIVLTPRTTSNEKYVAMERKTDVIKPSGKAIRLAENDSSYDLNIGQSTLQKTEFRTSATDRAIGGLIDSIHYYLLFSVFVSGVVVWAKELPILSLSVFLIFSLAMLSAWTTERLFKVAISIEGIGLFEAWKRYKIVEKEQAERWKYYRGE